MLNLLQSEWFPSVRAAVFVGIFVQENLLKSTPPSWYVDGMFDELFVKEYDYEVIKEKADVRIVIHGDDDPYCAYDTAVETARKMEATLITVPGGKHLSVECGGVIELPWAIEALSEQGILER